MADGFVNIPIETDSRTLADNAVTRLRDQWEGWEPNEADQEVVVIESLAPMAADTAQAAVRVPPAIFRAFGTKLAGVPYEQGSPATTLLTFTLIDASGYTIEAGTEVDVGGWAFSTDEAVTAAPGNATVTDVPATANLYGAGGNDLGPTATMVTSRAYIASVTSGVTSDGSDPEDDPTYQDRLTRELQLQAKTLVVARDYELLGLSEPGVSRIMAFADPDNRTVRVVATTAPGEGAGPGIKESLLARYNELRLSNWVVSIDDPTYTTISITYAVHPYPGFNADDLLARIDSMLFTWLAPNVWGRPKNFGDPGSALGFAIDPYVRQNKLIDLIGDVDGVDYVDSLIITGSQGADDGRGNFVMPGDVPLPRPGFMSGAIV